MLTDFRNDFAQLQEEIKKLKEALNLVELDAHTHGTRPCETCAKISHILNRPFGCYHVQNRMPTEFKLK